MYRIKSTSKVKPPGFYLSSTEKILRSGCYSEILNRKIPPCMTRWFSFATRSNRREKESVTIPGRLHIGVNPYPIQISKVILIAS